VNEKKGMLPIFFFFFSPPFAIVTQGKKVEKGYDIHGIEGVCASFLF